MVAVRTVPEPSPKSLSFLALETGGVPFPENVDIASSPFVQGTFFQFIKSFN